MATETILKKFNINLLTEEQYEEAKTAGTLSEDEVYFIQSEDAALLYTAQTLTEEQQAQVRANLGLEKWVNALIAAALANITNGNEVSY